MAKLYKVWILLILELHVQTFVTASLRISPNKTWSTVKIGDDWSVTCEGDAPVTWNIVSTQNITELDRIRLVYQNVSESGNYSSTLSVNNVNELYMVPTYKCQYQDPNKNVTPIPVNLWIDEELRETPRINHTLADAVRVGDTFMLNCSITFSNAQNYWYQLDWTLPPTADQTKSSVDSELFQHPKSAKKTVSRVLTLTNATKEEAGEYVCTLKSFTFMANSSFNLKVYDELEQFLNVTADPTSIVENAGNTAKWVIFIDSVPAKQKIEWFDKNGQRATRNRRFNINVTNSKQIVLSIKNVTLEDDGDYELRVTNGVLNNTLVLNLSVNGEPSVTITTGSDNVYGKFFHVNTNVTFICEAKGNPYPNITWELEKCPLVEDPRCTQNLGHGRLEEFSGSGKGTRSTLTLEVTNNSYIHCRAINALSNDSSEKEIKVIDFESPSTSGFDLLGDREPVEGTTTVFICAARKLDYKNDIKWFKENYGLWERLNPTGDNWNIYPKETPWSYKSHLRITNFNERYTGNYSCTVSNLSGQLVYHRNLTAKVQKMVPPKFLSKTNLDNKTVTYGRGDTIPELVCGATGKPTPKITWIFNKVGEDEWTFDSLKSKMIGNLSYLKIPSKTKYQGIYTCVADNGLAQSRLYKDIKIEGDYWWIIAVALSFVVVVLLVYLVFKIYKDRRAKMRLMKLLQDELEKGSPGDINPELPVHEQVNLLPYYDTFEIPRDKINLGMILGQGAFGKVLKAEVFGVVPSDGSKTVAVKMVKANSNQSHLDALAKELKILVHLGKHINVVNLIGACTKNYAKKKELLVVVEYCRYGNLLKYLHRHRKEFVNQLNSSTGKIDPVYYASRASRSPTQNLNYAALTFAHSQSDRPDSSRYLKMEQVPHMPDITMQVSLNPSSSNYLTGSNARSMNTEMSFVSDYPAGTDGRRMSTDSTCMSYRGDYQHQEVEQITTTSLVAWAFQIATGMDYLARRNVVHGDLAARNVLLADNDVVKICDFGLAREMYQDMYQKQKDKSDLLPVKWMAIESLRDFKFSTKSDVWSYGVVLWELFTLGNSPYPGMEPDAAFYNLLAGGFRMNKPEFASSDIYDLMNKCWDLIPENRPTFASIADDMGDMCDQSLREHYIALNEDCNRENSRMLEGREDYLMQMPVSDIMLRGSSPDDRLYVNIAPEMPNNDYLRPLPVNRPADYVTIQPDSSPPPGNFFNNFVYHSVNPNTPNQDSSNTGNIVSPRPEKSDQRFEFCGVELTDFSKCKNKPTVDKNILTPESNNVEELRNPEIEAFSNNSYVSIPSVVSNKPDNYNDNLEIFDIKNIKNDLVKADMSKRKKNDSGVSSSSSGQVSDSESPRSSLKESHSVPNGYVGSNIHGIIVENQNYFSSQSIVPNGDL